MSDDPNVTPEEGGQETAPALLDLLPEDLRSDPNLQSFNDVPSLAKSFIHAQRMIGMDKLPIPGPNATDEDWNVVYDRLGRPEAPDKYELPAPPDGFELDPDMASAFRETAHKLGLNAKQAAGLFDWYTKTVSEQLAALETEGTAAREEAERELRAELGRAYDDSIKLAQRVVKQFGGDDLVETLERTGFGNDPALTRFLIKIGKALSEDQLPASGGQTQFALTPAQAKAEIAKLNMDSNFMEAYQTHGHPAHAEAVAKMAELYKAAYPEEPAA